ncbi:hypothetical protein J3B02_003540, partial [Coemansia erecta]
MNDSRQEHGNGRFEDGGKQILSTLRQSKTCIVAVGSKLLHNLGLEDIRSDPIIHAAMQCDGVQEKEEANKVLTALSKHCGSLAKASESSLILLLEHLVTEKRLVRVYVDNAYASSLIPKQGSKSISANTASAAAASSDQMAARLESLMVATCGRIDKFACVKCGAKSRLTQAVLFKAMCGQNVKCEACGDSRGLKSSNWTSNDSSSEQYGLVPDIFRAQENMQAAADQACLDVSSAADLLLILGNEAEANGSEPKSMTMESVLSILKPSAKHVALVNSSIKTFMQEWIKDKANADLLVSNLSAKMADESWCGDDSSAADSSDGNSRNYATNNRSFDTNDTESAAAEAVEAAAEKQARANAKSGKGRNRERTNLNHLLNFTMPARMPSPLPIVRPRRRAADYGAVSERQAQLNKMSFINANFRFVLKPHFWHNFMAITNRPDMQLRWEWIERVIMPVTSETVTCPICLSPPVAARIPKCGHVFCYPCILRYLSYAEKEEHGIRKCPVCWSAITHEDLLPVHLWTVQYRAASGSISSSQTPLQGASKPTSGVYITMCLMKRLRGTTVCLPRSSGAHIYTPEIIEAQRLANKEGAAKREGIFHNHSFPWTFTEGALPFAKFMLAGHSYCKEEYERELTELACDLIEEADDSMARMFIESATKNIEDALAAVRSPPDSDSRLEKRASKEQANLITSLQSTDDSTGTANTGADLDELYRDDFLYFYQADDGQHIYMHPLYMRVLAHGYGSYVSLPDSLQIKLRHSVESTITDEVRHQFRFLDHLSLRCDVVFVEPELKGLVSRKSIEKFKRQISQRDKQHAARARHIAMDEARSAMLAAAASAQASGSSAGYNNEWPQGGYSHFYNSPDTAIDRSNSGAPPDDSSFPALASEDASEIPGTDSVAATPMIPASSAATDSSGQRSAWPREPLPQQSLGSHRAS